MLTTSRKDENQQVLFTDRQETVKADKGRWKAVLRSIVALQRTARDVNSAY